jgi:hypothetical protein
MCVRLPLYQMMIRVCGWLAGGQRSSGQRCRGQRDRHAVRDNLDEVAACGRAELGIELRSSRDDPEITHVGAGHGIGRSGPQA